MKKTIFLYPCLIFITLLSSCVSNKIPLCPGEYESQEVTENDYFSKAKYIISEIDKQEYINANSINVIKDGGSLGLDQKYYSFNLYFYIDSLDKFIKIETKHFNFKSDSSSVYTAVIEYISNEFTISKSIVFDCHRNMIFWSEERDNATFEMRLFFHLME